MNVNNRSRGAERSGLPTQFLPSPTMNSVEGFRRTSRPKRSSLLLSRTPLWLLHTMRHVFQAVIVGILKTAFFEHAESPF